MKRLTRTRQAKTAPPAVHNVLRSPGKPLDAETRVFFESRFGHDFGRVRVHADEPAAASAQSVDARAYAVGQHVVFDRGRYNPSGQAGRELLAHELAHTIQQGRVSNPPDALPLGTPGDAGEREARAAAGAALGRGAASLRESRGAVVQREPNPQSSAPSLELGESASPMLAAAIGSITIDSFETGKSDISPANRDKLATTAMRIVRLEKQYPGSTVLVIGHTDAIGKEENNMVLGQSRADSVKAALVDLGVTPDSIQTESKGESQLLVKTQRAEPRNRRVEVRFQPSSMPSLHLDPSLTLTLPPPPGPMPAQPPPIDLNIHQLPGQGPLAPTAPTLPPDFWKPIPPAPKKSGTSLDDVLDRVAGKITSFLPEAIRDKARDIVKGALEKGVTSGLDSALQSAGVPDKERKAIGKAAEAAMKQKFGGSQ